MEWVLRWREGKRSEGASMMTRCWCCRCCAVVASSQRHIVMLSCHRAITLTRLAFVFTGEDDGSSEGTARAFAFVGEWEGWGGRRGSGVGPGSHHCVCEEEGEGEGTRIASWVGRGRGPGPGPSPSSPSSVQVANG